MALPWPLGLILLLCGYPSAQAEPLLILVTPRVLRVGTPEKVHVQAHPDWGQPPPRNLEVKLSVWDFPLRTRQVAEAELSLTPQNHFMLQAAVTIPESLVYPPQPGQQYVIIRVTWASSVLEKPVLVAPHAGYIFIQTDKTIYNPEHFVLYRIFTVNHQMDPVSRPITLDIKNPEGVTVFSQNLQAQKGFFVSSFHLPELLSFGTWSIEASYQSAAKQKFKADFEVKEYVLPPFEVQLKPNTTFFHLRNEALGVDIQARYIFNKPLDGHALAIFGVQLDSRRIPIQSSLQRVEISRGLGHAVLQKDTLMATFQGMEDDFLGASVFANVTVFSSGGEMVQAEASGVKIVRSPYKLKFFRTPKYFKPGMPFHFRLFVSNPDGSPASRVSVCYRNQSVFSSPSGIAAMTINTDANWQQLPIQVETKDESLRPEEQASATMTALPYATQDGSGNFLHIDLKALGTDVGSVLQLNLNTKHRDPHTKEQITHFTILILSKGQIVGARYQPRSPGSVYTTAIIDVSPDMLPSIRIVAFYLLPPGRTGGDPELVSDSLWIDVNDRCMGTLKVGLKNEDTILSLSPQSKVELKVTGNAEATVGLLVVDKALHVLNSKHKLTQKKVWDVVEEHDIGCTAGSGKDRLAVFKDAGLDLKLSTGMDTLASSDWRCPQEPPVTRRRRELKRIQAKKNAVDKFETQLERKCCEAGLRESPAGLTCEERKRHVRPGPACVAAFLSCCHLSEALTQQAREEQLFLGTSDDEDDEDEDFFLEDLPIRTSFPESWLWKTFTLSEHQSGISHYTTEIYMPDSITTWQLVAVSLKEGQGLCVSEPLELTVQKSFFVDLKLPHSVIRNEQIQVQAVLYNFRDQAVRVRVEFPHKETLCSASKPGSPWRQRVVVPPTSSKMVPYMLIPLETGQVDVEVKIVSIEARDHIRKTLLVRPEGQIEKNSQSFLLSPEGQTQMMRVPRKDIQNQVPGTEAEVFISVQGDILAETVLGSLTPQESRRLLSIPTGCPEQTLSSLAPLVLLTRYLDTTGQWGQVGVELREKVAKNIVSGYTRMVTHRSADGTYHISKGRPGSTWLTSYVFRIYSLAQHTATIPGLDLKSLCAMADWLCRERQAEDGHFVERGPVVMASMQGGYKGSEADVSLTALVLIALEEGMDMCKQEVPILPASMERARSFLEMRLPHIQTIFATAIASYALALTESPRANDCLQNFDHLGKTLMLGQHQTFSLSSIEAMAYILMQKLRLGLHNETHTIAKWLLEQRELGGGFRSTQTTVVAMEALTRYRQAVHAEGIQDLYVQISIPKRALNLEWVVDQSNAYQQRTAKFSALDDLEIKASGRGTGTISIVTMYHKAPEAGEDSCNLYQLNVTLLRPEKQTKSGEETFQLRIKTRFQGEQEATMSIVEISLLTGFYPNQEDLKQLTSEVETYAFQYESKPSASDSTVVLYLEKVSNKEDTVLGFRVHRMLQAEFLQAAQVTIYDYYEPSRRCSTFYNLPQEPSSLRKICHKEVCRCAEEQCPAPKGSSQMKKEELQVAACEAGVDFVYKVRLESVGTSASNPYIYYNMQLQTIIKTGSDSVKPLTMKKFISHATCQDVLQLHENQTYLIMGHTSDLWRIQSDYTYVLTKNTFLMPWPADGDVGRKDSVEELEGFSEHMHAHGCET
ncbi:complement C3-like [Sorex fumeus]|uniref:complement C3-like n=1 Tax=Sorex fumeus TaxID=62283 RepID=UPI0024AD3ED0|nr:complement C3-like [Sorex fumeus]